MNPEDQITPDLNQEGVELAEKKAEELLSRFDPEHDILFLASSDEARALETANVYRKIAHTKGFEIMKPHKTGTRLAGEVGEGEIRTVHNLSLNSKNLLAQALFNPDYQNESVNWDALDSETRAKYDKVRQLVAADDRGSFGANFFHHSETAAEILPEIKTARELYKVQFKNLLRLAGFGVQKAQESGVEKNVKILAFGHENYMGYAMDRYFEEHDIKNCETIDVETGDSDIVLTKRGATASVNENVKKGE